MGASAGGHDPHVAAVTRQWKLSPTLRRPLAGLRAREPVSGQVDRQRELLRRENPATAGVLLINSPVSCYSCGKQKRRM